MFSRHDIWSWYSGEPVRFREGQVQAARQADGEFTGLNMLAEYLSGTCLNKCGSRHPQGNSSRGALKSRLRWLRAPATTDNRAGFPPDLHSPSWAKRASTARSPCSSARSSPSTGVSTMRSMRPRMISAASVTVSGALSASARRPILLR